MAIENKVIGIDELKTIHDAAKILSDDLEKEATHRELTDEESRAHGYLAVRLGLLEEAIDALQNPLAYSKKLLEKAEDLYLLARKEEDAGNPQEAAKFESAASRLESQADKVISAHVRINQFPLEEKSQIEADITRLEKEAQDREKMVKNVNTILSIIDRLMKLTAVAAGAF
jgi:tetratricopeptide (TPR) repeat protein